MDNGTVKKNDYIWADAMKGLAILGVLLIHSGNIFIPGIIGKFIAQGSRGVQFFFVISAILAFESLHRRFADPKDMDLYGVLLWYRDRFVRLIPLYYLSLLLNIILNPASSWLGSIGHITIENILLHLFFLHGFFPLYINSIINVEWYLGVLAMFYILAPVLYRFIDNLYKAVFVFAAGVFICYFINSYIYSQFPTDVDESIYFAFSLEFSFFVQFPILLMGIVVYFILQSKAVAGIKGSILTSYLLMLLGMAVIIFEVISSGDLKYLTLQAIFAIGFSLIIISQQIRPSLILTNPVFSFIGKYSYGIYLFHYLFIILYGRYITDEAMDAWYIKYPIVIAVSLPVSILVTKCFDAPVQRLLSRKKD